jgi:hypothetical protein
VLFTSDFYKTDEIYAFFKKNIRIDEMELVILDLSNLFFSHARYQELNAFMDKFLKDFPDSPLSVQVHIFFAKNYESLKKRDHVVASFTKANELCSPNSAWRNKTSKEMVQDSCFMKLRSFQQELTTKWWEIWEKNKNHSDFNELLISFLRSAIQNEAFDTEEINKKTRYLLAELLFHNKKYLEASQEYFLVGEQSREPKLRHDSYYAALFSYGKYSEQNPESISTPETQKQILILAEQYLEFSPEGAYSDDVHLKLAILFLAQKDYNRAENHLKPLWVSKEETLRSKAQDAKLELLNIQKNFRELKELSAEWAKNTPASIRRKALEKISKEAEFNEIVLGKTSHEKILEYARHNKESSLGREALWKILSNSFSLKKDKDAMAYGEEFIKYFPEDKEASIVRKELISIYLDYGFFKKAASLMGKSPDLSVQDHEKQGDFFQLENMWKLAYESYLPLLNKFPIGSRDYLRIYEKIEDLSQKDTSIITHSISNQLARRGLEPFATRALVRSAENLFNERKYTEAFEISRKINSREVSPEEKFSARILQAQVLEKEFISQSMKASPERFPLVFNIKVEKFDKAFSAYSDALLLTSKPEKQLLALIGIQNNFKHFISALENLSGPPSVDGKEKLNLKHEMAELLSAIKQRQIENQEKIKSLQNRSLPNLSSHRTLAFLQDPKTIQDWPLWISQRPDFKSMSRSRNKGNLWKSEDILDDINNSELREWNLYRLAVEAYQEQKYEKTNFLLSQMKIPTSAGNYLRGSLFIKQNKFNEASKEFQILLEKDTDIEELKILTSFESFDRKDHLTVIDNLEKLKIFPRRDLHVVSIYVDSLIESGYREKAEKFLSSSAAGERDSAVKTALLSKLENISVNSKNYIRSRSSTSEEKENLKLEVK